MPVWLGVGLALSLLATGVLGFLVIDLRRELAAADSRIEDAVQEGEETIDVALAQALAAVPDTAELERADAAQERINREQQAELDTHTQLLEQQGNQVEGLTAFGGSTIDASDIEVPLFCSGEPVFWSSGFGRGLTC